LYGRSDLRIAAAIFLWTIRKSSGAQGACFGYNIVENKCQTKAIVIWKISFLVNRCSKAVNQNFYLLLNNRFLLFFRNGMGVFLPEIGQKQVIWRL